MQVKIGSMVKFYTMLLLYEGSKHGYELMKELEEKLGKKISTSQVYPFLDTLRNNKLVHVQKIGERDKKVYSLTSKGRECVDNLVQRFGDLLDIAIKPKLSVCAHCGCKVYKGGYKEKFKGREIAFCCCHCAESFKKLKGEH